MRRILNFTQPCKTVVSPKLELSKTTEPWHLQVQIQKQGSYATKHASVAWVLPHTAGRMGRTTVWWGSSVGPWVSLPSMLMFWSYQGQDFSQIIKTWGGGLGRGKKKKKNGENFIKVPFFDTSSGGWFSVFNIRYAFHYLVMLSDAHVED